MAWLSTCKMSIDVARINSPIVAVGFILELRSPGADQSVWVNWPGLSWHRLGKLVPRRNPLLLLLILTLLESLNFDHLIS